MSRPRSACVLVASLVLPGRALGPREHDGVDAVLETTLDDGAGAKLGGAFKPEPAAAKWPKELLRHAERTWKQLAP